MNVFLSSPCFSVEADTINSQARGQMVPVKISPSTVVGHLLANSAQYASLEMRNFPPLAENNLPMRKVKQSGNVCTCVRADVSKAGKT